MIKSEGVRGAHHVVVDADVNNRHVLFFSLNDAVFEFSVVDCRFTEAFEIRCKEIKEQSKKAKKNFSWTLNLFSLLFISFSKSFLIQFFLCKKSDQKLQKKTEELSEKKNKNKQLFLLEKSDEKRFFLVEKLKAELYF